LRCVLVPTLGNIVKGEAKVLDLSWSKVPHLAADDRHTLAQLTRFLPDDVLQHFERISLETKAAPERPVDVTVSADIRKKIAAMWA